LRAAKQDNNGQMGELMASDRTTRVELIREDSSNERCKLLIPLTKTNATMYTSKLQKYSVKANNGLASLLSTNDNSVRMESKDQGTSDDDVDIDWGNNKNDDDPFLQCALWNDITEIKYFTDMMTKKRRRLVIHDEEEEEEDDRIVIVDEVSKHNTTGIDAHTRSADDFNSNEANNAAENVEVVNLVASSVSNNNDGSHCSLCHTAAHLYPKIVFIVEKIPIAFFIIDFSTLSIGYRLKPLKHCTDL
jgi:hypothetical protein